MIMAGQKNNFKKKQGRKFSEKDSYKTNSSEKKFSGRSSSARKPSDASFSGKKGHPEQREHAGSRARFSDKRGAGEPYKRPFENKFSERRSFDKSSDYKGRTDSFRKPFELRSSDNRERTDSPRRFY